MIQLESYLQAIAEKSESYFQQHLAKEDLARVGRLAEMARAAESLEALQHDGLYIGWTPGDLRTGELKEQLLPLIEAMHAALEAPDDADLQLTLLDAWKAFHEARIKVLIHCL